MLRPVLARPYIRVSANLDAVAALQLLLDRGKMSVYLGVFGMHTHFGVNVKREVDGSRRLWQ